MTRAPVATIAFVLLVLPPLVAQQTGLTDAHLKSSEAEVPQIVELLELKPGMTVADVGAGFGAWTLRLSRWVGPEGRVYANEVGESQLAALHDIVEREHLTNVSVVKGAMDSTNLPAGCCDAILVRDVYHHLVQPEDIVRSLAAALKPGGRLAVIDFPPRPGTEVPAGVPADRRGHGIPPDIVQREGSAVLTYVRTIPDWAPDSRPASLYLVLFRK